MVTETQSVEAPAGTRRSRRAWRLFASVLAAGALIVTGAWLYASPYLVFEQFKADAAEGDADGLRAWADPPLIGRLPSVLAAVRGAGGRFETGYQSYGRFEVRLAAESGAAPVTLLFRRDGPIWRLTDVQGLAAEPARPAQPAPAPLRFAALLGRAGAPAAEFLAAAEIRAPLEKLLGADMAALEEGLRGGPGVQVQGNRLFLSGCGAEGCKASESAMTFDAGTGDLSAAVLKDGKLTVYSEKVAVIEDLPDAMQKWLDHLTSAAEDASIPVSFRAPQP